MSRPHTAAWLVCCFCGFHRIALCVWHDARKRRCIVALLLRFPLRRPVLRCLETMVDPLMVERSGAAEAIRRDSWAIAENGRDESDALRTQGAPDSAPEPHTHNRVVAHSALCRCALCVLSSPASRSSRVLAVSLPSFSFVSSPRHVVQEHLVEPHHHSVRRCGSGSRQRQHQQHTLRHRTDVPVRMPVGVQQRECRVQAG